MRPRIGQSGGVPAVPEPGLDWPEQQQWLTVPDLAELLGLTPSRVRRLFEERALGAVRIDGVLRTPAEFIRDGQPLGELKGTLVLLHDCGFSDDEAVHWLVMPQELLGGARPVDALLAGRKAEVRRVAQSLSF